MKTIAMRLAILGILLVGATALTARSFEPGPRFAKPTIVLVHGAFADSSSWSAVESILRSRGYPVVAAANPLRSVKSDAVYVENLLNSIVGPIVLVGHSYGGSVISNVGNEEHKIKALVYVAAFAPEAGETASELSVRFPGSSLGAALLPPVALADGDHDLYIDQRKFAAQFAADIPAKDALRAAIGQRPVTDSALNEPSGSPVWASVPSWWIYGSRDKNIPPAAMAFMARRAGSKLTIEIKGASHVVMMSHPDEVARLIMEAADSH